MSAVSERRLFLKYLGAGFAGYVANAATPLGPLAEARGAMPFQLGEAAAAAVTDFLTFGPISPDQSRRAGAAGRVSLPHDHRLRRQVHLARTSASASTPISPRSSRATPRARAAFSGSTTSTSAPPPTTTGRRSPPPSAACPTIDDYKVDVGGSAVEIYKTEGGNWLVVRGSGAQPPLHRRLARHRRRPGARRRIERRRHAGQLLGLPDAVEHHPHVRGELSGLRAREPRHRRTGHGRRPLQQERHALRLGGRDRSAGSRVDSR